MEDSQSLTLAPRALFCPRHLMWALLILYALFEFFPVNYGLTTVSFLAVCAFAVAWLLAFPATPLISRQNYQPLLFFGFWLAYSLFSYIWALNRDLALEGSFLVFRYMAVFWLFDALFRQAKLLKHAHGFFATVLGLYLLIAVWEMLSFQHLPSSRYYGMALYYIPTGPFYNQNNLAAFMLFLLPFLLFLPKLAKGKHLKPLVILGSLLFFGIITLQGARIAMLGAGLLFFAVGLLNSSFKTKIALLLLIFLAVWGVMQIKSPLLNYGWKMVEKEMESFGTERESAHMSSIKIRKQLIRETLDLAEGSGFMGLGGGNFEHYMDTDRMHRTAGITNAHNWFLEILGNYGILVLLGFAYLCVHWFWALWQRFRAATGRMRILYLAYIWALIMFVPTSALPSSIRWNHHIWIIFAAINAMAHNDEILLKDL